MRTPSLLRAKIEATTLLSGASWRQLRERDQLWVLPLAGAGILLAAGLMIFMLFQNYRAMAILGSASGNPELPFFVATLVAWVLVFVIGFPLALSVLYSSRDGQLLRSLPLRRSQIVAANTGLLYLYVVPVSLLAFVPAVVAHAMVHGTDAGAIVAAVVVNLALPLVPLGIAIVLVTGLVRLVNLSRFRTALEMAGMVILVIALLGFQLLFSRTLMASGDIRDLSASLARILEEIQSAFPPALWVARAFGPRPAPWIAVTVGLAAAVILVCGLMVQAGYARRIANQAVTSTPRRKSGPAAIPDQRPVMQALVGREIRLLTSNSTFLFESVGELLIFPIILLVFRLTVPGEVMMQLLPFLDTTPYVLPAVLALLLLFAGINTVSASAISREGPAFDLSLSLPLSGRVQVRGKIATYLALFWPALTVNAAIAVSLLRLPWWHAVVLSVSGVPYLLLLGSATIYADIRRPLLNWTHPQQAVKQNMNVLVGMGLAVLAVGAASVPAVLVVLGGLPAALVIITAAGAAAAGAAVVYRLVTAYADRRYALAFSAAGP